MSKQLITVLPDLLVRRKKFLIITGNDAFVLYENKDMKSISYISIENKPLFTGKSGRVVEKFLNIYNKLVFRSYDVLDKFGITQSYFTTDLHTITGFRGISGPGYTFRTLICGNWLFIFHNTLFVMDKYNMIRVNISLKEKWEPVELPQPPKDIKGIITLGNNLIIWSKDNIYSCNADTLKMRKVVFPERVSPISDIVPIGNETILIKGNHLEYCYLNTISEKTIFITINGYRIRNTQTFPNGNVLIMTSNLFEIQEGEEEIKDYYILDKNYKVRELWRENDTEIRVYDSDHLIKYEEEEPESIDIESVDGYHEQTITLPKGSTVVDIEDIIEIGTTEEEDKLASMRISEYIGIFLPVSSDMARIIGKYV